MLGFAKEVSRHDLPFQLNWSGPNIKDMRVDDNECLKALVKMVKALEELQPNIPGINSYYRDLLYQFLKISYPSYSAVTIT